MLKTFPIEFVRQVLEQTLLKEHKKNPNYFGGKDQVNILSFYEQLKSQDEVDRFVETYRDLTNQQNRTGLILNGVLVSPENPTLTNLYSCTIVPMTWSCSFRCTLENRDQAIETLNNLIEELKGRKVDVAQLKCIDANGKPYYQPFMVGTIGENDLSPKVNNGDYVDFVFNASDIPNRLSTYSYKGFEPASDLDTLYYGETMIKVGKLEEVDDNDNSQLVWHEVVDDGTYNDIIFPPEHTEFEKYKLSMSFDTIRCDEPRTLNAEEYCELTISGSATLVSRGVQLGNDLIKISIQKKKIDADTPITFNSAPIYYLEPLEMPSGSNINTQVNQLISNKFVTNSHADAISLTLQYTFIYDSRKEILKQLFKYGRYGKQGLTVNDISPNMIYEVKEYWSSWGEVERETVKTKIVENIDIENTESDTLTMSLTMQIQGEQ